MLIRNFTNDKFIRAYNSFANTESEFYLNDEEFYMYSVLFTNQMMDGSIRTNIDIINQFIPIKFIQNDTKNKAKVKSLISSLIKKKVLIVENEIDDLKNNTLLELNFNDIEMSNDGLGEDKKVTDGKFKNFSKIPYDKFLTFESTKDYYIYYTVSRWPNGFSFSYNSWAEVLGLKHQESALRVIEDVVKREIIHKNIGDYNSRTKQDSNVYSIHPFTEERKTKQTKKVEQKQANVKREEKLNDLPYSDERVKEINEALYFFKTYKDDEGNVFPMDYHYALYLEVKEIKNPSKLEKDLINAAEKRINQLNNNPQFQREFEEGIRLHKKQQNDKIINQLETATNAIKMKNGSVVIVDEVNIDSIDWREVNSTYYGDEKLYGSWEMVSFQPCHVNGGHEDRPDMIECGWELYKQHVKTGKMLTHSLREQIQSKVFADKLSDKPRVHEAEVIDMSLVLQETNEEPVYTKEDMLLEQLNESTSNSGNLRDWIDNTYKKRYESVDDIF